MKSLKNIESLNQVSNDYLLKITRQPPITCPLINALQFSGLNQSSLYDLVITEKPNNLSLDPTELLETIGELEKWSTALVDLYHSHPEISMKLSSSAKDIIEFAILDINRLIESNPTNELLEYSSKINSIISDWDTKHDEYSDLKDDSSTEDHTIYEINCKISFYDDGKNDDVLAKLKEEKEMTEQKIERINKKLLDLENDFHYNITVHFEDQANEFSRFLENVRSNNDELRSRSYALRTHVVALLKNTMDLRQPMEYLKELESGKDSEISLGIIKSRERNVNFFSLCRYLHKNGVLSDIEFTLLRKETSVDSLLPLLKSKGYETIRYYENKDAFLKDKNNFIEVNYKKNKPLLKTKMQ